MTRNWGRGGCSLGWGLESRSWGELVKSKFFHSYCNPTGTTRLLGPGGMWGTEGTPPVRNENTAPPNSSQQFPCKSGCPPTAAGESGGSCLPASSLRVNADERSLGTSGGLITDKSIFSKSHKVKISSCTSKRYHLQMGVSDGTPFSLPRSGAFLTDRSRSLSQVA